MRALIFDTETTGLTVRGQGPDHTGQPWPVSIAAILTDECLVPIKLWHTVIKLPEGVEIHEKAQEVHGYSWEDTQKGEEPAEALKIFKELLTHSDVNVAYNREFDETVINALMYRTLEKPNYATMWGRSKGICAMQAATQFLRVPTRLKLSQAYRRVMGRHMINAHDAMGDSLATLDIFKTILGTYEPENVVAAKIV